MKNASWVLTSAFAFATASCGGSDEGGGPCAGVTCSAHGECTEDGASARCDCDEGYVVSGLACVPEGGDSDSDTDADTDSDSDSDTGTGTDCGAGLILDETEDNDSCETAEDLGPCVELVRGTFGNDPTPCDDPEFFTFQIDAQADVTVQMNDVAGDGCGSSGEGTNNIVSVYPVGCGAALGTNDNGDGTLCASLDLPALAAGSYVVAVTAYLYCDYSGCGCLPGSNTDWELEIIR